MREKFVKHRGNMETEDPSPTQCPGQDVLANSNDVYRKRTINRCKVCRKKFRNHALYTAHLKLHKVTRRLPNPLNEGKVINGSNKSNDLVFQCRICGSKHVGFSQCFEHQKLHEQHSKYFEKVYTSEVVAENHNYHNTDNQNEQPAEVIIATTEDVELLADGNAIINVITNIGDTNHHNDDGNTSKIQSDIDSRDVIIAGGVHGHNDVIQSCEDVTVLQAHEEVEVIPRNDVNMLQQHKERMSEQESLSNQIPISFSSPPLVTTATSKMAGMNDEAMQIDIPSQVKAIYLNNTGPELGDVLKRLDELNKKVDFIIKHLNSPTDSVTTQLPLETDSIDMDGHDEKDLENDEDEESVVLEGYPPSYSVIQAAKEQQQQEYYAATMANRQGQLFKPNEGHILSVSPSDMKVFQKKPIEVWVPGQQYLTSLSPLSPANEEEESNDTTLVPKHVVEKVFVESRSRANFAKNLCFAIFTYEERQGKNCTGRVFGKAQHKGQLDPVKVQSIKEATFRKYPCNPCLVDITWRKECVTAIDSGLRNEHRTAKLHTNGMLNQQSSSMTSIPKADVVNVYSKSQTPILLHPVSSSITSVQKIDVNEFNKSQAPVLLHQSNTSITPIAKIDVSEYTKTQTSVLLQQTSAAMNSIKVGVNNQVDVNSSLVDNNIVNDFMRKTR